MNSFEILARIYDLLGSSTIDELLATAKIKDISPTIKESLHLLAKEKEGNEKKININNMKRSKSNATLIKKIEDNGSNSDIPTDREKKIEQLITSKDFFTNNDELTDYLNKSNLGISFNINDGRPRMLKKVIKRISDLSPSEKSNAYENLFRIFPKSEISGWFDAIRGSRS